MRYVAVTLLLLANATASGVEFVETVSRPPATFPPTLLDIASHLPLNTPYKDADLITYAHEGTHGLARGASTSHGIYILRGLRVMIPTPPVTMLEVERAVPENRRGPVYKTYMNQGRHVGWKDQPLMLVDEWVAYTHGSMVRSELHQVSRQETDRYCGELCFYVSVMYTIAKERKAPTGELRSFCRWNLDRCRKTIANWDGLPAFTAGAVTFD